MGLARFVLEHYWLVAELERCINLNLILEKALLICYLHISLQEVILSEVDQFVVKEGMLTVALEKENVRRTVVVVIHFTVSNALSWQ